MIGVRCLSVVVCRLLCVASCSLLIARCWLLVVGCCCLLCVRCSLLVVCCLLMVVVCLLSDGCYVRCWSVYCLVCLVNVESCMWY